MEQHLHSIHCQRYLRTERIILGVNWRHEGCPERPQSEQETSCSGVDVFRFSAESPKQKSQYGDGATRALSSESARCL